MISAERMREVDERHRKSVEEALLKGGRAPVIAGDKDWLGGGVWLTCRLCKKSVVVRPWLARLIERDNLPVICTDCVLSDVAIGDSISKLMEETAVKLGLLPKQKGG